MLHFLAKYRVNELLFGWLCHIRAAIPLLLLSAEQSAKHPVVPQCGKLDAPQSTLLFGTLCIVLRCTCGNCATTRHHSHTNWLSVSRYQHLVVDSSARFRISATFCAPDTLSSCIVLIRHRGFRPPPPSYLTQESHNAGLSGRSHGRCHGPYRLEGRFRRLQKSRRLSPLRSLLCRYLSSLLPILSLLNQPRSSADPPSSQPSAVRVFQDIYTSPVSIKSCHHTFCSTCIRTHINQSGNSGSFCPKCRQTKAYDSELIPQPVLEVTALEWKKSRSFLARLQQDQEQSWQRLHTPQAAATSSISGPSSSKRRQSDQNGEAFDGVDSPLRASSPRRSKRIKTDARTTSTLLEQTTGSRSSPLTIDDEDDDLIDNTDDEYVAGSSTLDSDPSRRARDEDDRDGDYDDGAASSRSSPSKRRNHRAQEATSKISDRELKADDLVECPICSHKFTVTALNRHLDSARCYPGFPEPSPEERGLATKPAKSTSSWFTKGAPSTTSATDGATSMANEKRLIRPQYNLKSERDLRKLLDDAGLPTSGDREKMVERHRQWINIWNANLDSTKARRSAVQLRKDLAAWERTKTSAKDHSAHVDRQKTTWIVSSIATPPLLESQSPLIKHSSFAFRRLFSLLTTQKTNKLQFDDLIQKAKMSAMKDKKLHDASTTSSDEQQSHEAAAHPVSVAQGDTELDPHVITSSPMVPESASDARKPMETVGTDA